MIKMFDYFINNSSTNIVPIKPSTIHFYHLALVLKGTCTYLVDGQEIVMNENDALLLVPGTHRERPITKGYLHIVIVNFFAEEETAPKANQFFKNAINQTIKKMLNVYPYKAYIKLAEPKTNNSDNPKVYGILLHVFECILIELYDSLKYPTQNPHIINIIKYINDNVTKPISLTDVSNTAHLSKEYTSRLFKQEMGLTVSEYINQQKLFLAKDMLANTNISLQTVSANLGYENYTYFTKLFKETFRISPQKMRKELKNSNICSI